MRVKRLVLKLSGEALGSETESFNIDCIHRFVKNLLPAVMSREVLIVVGGGNFFRGVESQGLDINRAKADQMGMLATMMNGVFLKEVLESYGQKTALLSAIFCPHVCDMYESSKADQLLKTGHIVICVGGMSVPYFTTDTAAVLRASELKCDLVMKATKVKGVFSKDPLKYKDAELFQKLSFKDAMRLNLCIMDQAAFEMAQKHNIPIVVFSIQENIKDVLEGKCEHTIVSKEDI